MLQSVIAVLFLASSVSFAGGKPKSGAEFCENLKKNAPAQKDGKSLSHVRAALGIADSLGLSAKDSALRLKGEGFSEIAADVKDDYAKIPIGAILVLVGKNGRSCGVSEEYGHVAVKCGEDELYWVAGQTIKLSENYPKLKDCVRSVIYHVVWNSPPAKPGKPAVQRSLASEKEK